MRPARDRLEQVFQRLAARRDGERVFSKVYWEAARAAADASDRRHAAGSALGPLDGALVSIKDLFDVAGEPTWAGSALRRESAPAAVADAPVVRRLSEAGAVILGKTVMTEFAFTAVGLDPQGRTPGNAADPARVPGGSSSGAGVSVAEGTSEISIGSDTGGSVRIPAALNGVAGFKPTAARVPLEGVFPLSPSLDSVGPLAKNVAACADADAVMAGEASTPLDPAPLGGLRIGIPRGRLLEDLEPDVEKGFHACLERLGARGARLPDQPIDDLLDAFGEATLEGSIAAVEGAAIHRDWIGTADAAKVDPRAAGPLARAARIPPAVLAAMLERRAALAAEMDRRFERVDVIALPTTPIAAPRLAGLAEDRALYNRVEDLLLRNTYVANRFDLCSISLPMPGTALPAGFMLLGRHGHDRRLLEIAAAVEGLFR